MAWLEAWDQYIAQKPPAVQFVYLVTKWLLVVLGGFMLVRLFLDRIGVWPLY